MSRSRAGVYLAGDSASQAMISRIEAAGWGFFFVWLGVAIAADIGWGIALMGTGIISLGVQAARGWLGLPIDRWSIGFGGCLTAAGLVQRLGIPVGGTSLTSWALPVASVLVGIAILVRTWTRKGR